MPFATETRLGGLYRQGLTLMDQIRAPRHDLSAMNLRPVALSVAAFTTGSGDFP